MKQLIKKLGPVYDVCYPGKTGYLIRCLGGAGVSRQPIRKEILIDDQDIYNNMDEPLIISHISEIIGWGELDGPCYVIQSGSQELSIPIRLLSDIGFTWQPQTTNSPA